MTTTASPPLVTIVTPTRDRPDRVANLLRSIDCQTYSSLEVLIVDDGSSPPLQATGGKVRVLRHAQSLGFCLANNTAFAKANGDFLLLLNDDAELADARVVERAVDLLLAHPEAGAIALAQLTPDGRLAPLQPASVSVRSQVARFLGYGCLLRKTLVDEIGGFNPVFGAYYEDIEMSMRIVQAGRAILFDPALRVVHHEDTRHRDYRRIDRLTFRNASLAALLRYPWFCVPAAGVSYLRNFVRATAGNQGLDVAGVGWVAWQVARQWRYVLRERRPMSAVSFRELRRLARQPVRLDDAAQSPAFARTAVNV